VFGNMRPRRNKNKIGGTNVFINAEAIIEAIKATRRRGIVNRIVITDSLSNLMAQKTLYTNGNSKKT
jgi:ribonuclease HI